MSMYSPKVLTAYLSNNLWNLPTATDSHFKNKHLHFLYWQMCIFGRNCEMKTSPSRVFIHANSKTYPWSNLVYRRYCSNITSGLYLVSGRRFSALKLRLAKSAKLAQIQPKNNDEWCP